MHQSPFKLGFYDRHPLAFCLRCIWRSLFLTGDDWLRLENATLGAAERLRHEVRFNEFYSSRDRELAAQQVERFDALTHQLFGPYPSPSVSELTTR